MTRTLLLLLLSMLTACSTNKEIYYRQFNMPIHPCGERACCNENVLEWSNT